MTWHVHCHVTCVILDSGHIWPQEEPSAYLHLPWSLSQGRRRQTASFHWERLGTKVVLCAQDCQGVMVTWPPYHHHRHHHHHHDHIVMISQHYHPTGWRSADEGAALSPNNPSGCERCFAGRYCFTAAGPVPCAGVRGRQAAPCQWGVAGQKSHAPCWRFNRPRWIWLVVSDDRGRGLKHVETTKRLKNARHPAAHGQIMGRHLNPRIHSWGDPWLFHSFLFPAQICL